MYNKLIFLKYNNCQDLIASILFEGSARAGPLGYMGRAKCGEDTLCGGISSTANDAAAAVGGT